MAGFRNFVIGCVLSAASIMAPVATAYAAPFAVPDLKVAQKTDVQTVNHRPGHGDNWQRPHRRPYPQYRRHYDNRRYYRPGVNVYIAPRPVYRERYIRRSYANSHVNWCLQRYRSYNPASNRFLAYGGVYRICRSPYR